MRIILSIVFAVAVVLTASSAFADSDLVNVGAGVVDVNGDGAVDGANDVPEFVAGLGADVVGPGQIFAGYNPITGEVLISMNNIGSLRIISDNNLLITANVPASIPGTVFHDPTTTNETNYGGFPLTTQDDYLMGAILPTGLAAPNEQFLAADLGRILYTVFGGGPSQTNLPLLLKNLAYVPEPSTFVLTLTALLAMFVLGFTRARSRRR
jgi:hypothetical protein